MPNYPLPWLEGDERMSYGLIVDVRTVLLRHGYPELTRVDMETLRVALVRFVFGRRISAENPASVDLNVTEPVNETPAQPMPSAEELAEGIDRWHAGRQRPYDPPVVTHMVLAQRGMTEAEVERFLTTGEIPDFSRPPVVDNQSRILEHADEITSDVAYAVLRCSPYTDKCGRSGRGAELGWTLLGRVDLDETEEPCDELQRLGVVAVGEAAADRRLDLGMHVMRKRRMADDEGLPGSGFGDKVV
ncbi:hypothetical protein ACQP26_19875 [Micromonospora sp. CA-248089]|uniref:hypothetical protein n=1 Tax=Micromonospora sp. CA-248089 TaxID=3239960 RepID=UPI003D9030DB